MQRRSWSELQITLAAGVLALVYFGSAKLGLGFALAAEQVTLVWPPSGIALAALLLFGRRVWPGIWLGAFIANGTAAEPPLIALVIATGNTLEGLVGAELLQRAGFHKQFARLRDALALIICAAALSTTISATVGAVALVLGRLQPVARFPELWRDWWIGDAVGILTVAPVLLSWGRTRLVPRLNRLWEALALALALLFASWIAFVQPDPRNTVSYPLHYLVFPFVAWGALRFGSRGSSLVVLVASAIAVLSIRLGLGRFGAGGGEQALLLLQLFLAVVAVTGLLLGAAINERDLAHEALSRAEEEQRLRARDLLQQDKKKDEFMARLAHELRNPLAPIAGAVRLLREKKGDVQAVERLREILDRQITHLLRLVDDLLDVSRITTGKVKLQPRRLDLQQVLRGAIEMSAPLLESRGVELRCDLPAETVWIQADAVRLAQIVQNLLSNAARHGGEGGHVHLTVQTEDGSVVLSVRDDGAGMTEDVLKNAFEPFAQGPGAGKNLGLGIGLTLVKELCELHGGEVAARSEGPGKGSEFIVRLPSHAPISSGSEPPHRSESRALGSASSRDVLVVDDNVDAAEMLAQLLSQRGHRVRVAYDGVRAIESARAAAPDVMLLDIEMPQMNGYAVARAIRDDPELSKMRLIAVSGHLEAGDGRRPMEAGFDQHMVKPVDPEALYAALERPIPALP